MRLSPGVAGLGVMVRRVLVLGLAMATVAPSGAFLPVPSHSRLLGLPALHAANRGPRAGSSDVGPHEGKVGASKGALGLESALRALAKSVASGAMMLSVLLGNVGVSHGMDMMDPRFDANNFEKQVRSPDRRVLTSQRDRSTEELGGWACRAFAVGEGRQAGAAALPRPGQGPYQRHRQGGHPQRRVKDEALMGRHVTDYASSPFRGL
jgi:hypothetical protein